MTTTGTIRGATRIADVPPAVLADLQAGRTATRTLAETLAVDFADLLEAAFPGLSGAGIDRTAGVTRRMAQAAAVVRQELGAAEAVAACAVHRSDIVRGWAAYAACAEADAPLADRIEQVRPLADDPHFAVREWAWLALRPHVAADVPQALALLRPWTAEAAPNLRRFAVEITRPRGVWCSHLPSLKADPAPGLVLLEPLRADPSRYVQDSVANWLNDASKTHGPWVEALCDRWRAETLGPHTVYIIRRACRSLRP